MTTLTVLLLIWIFGACWIEIGNFSLYRRQFPAWTSLAWPLYILAALYAITLMILIEATVPKIPNRAIPLFVFVLMIYTLAAPAAFGQTPPPAGLPDRLNLTLSRSMMGSVLTGLTKLPWETANPVIVEVQTQLNTQDQAAIESSRPKPAKSGDQMGPEGVPASK